MQTSGFMVLHSPGGRGVKTAVEAELREWLRDAFGLYLELKAVAPVEAVEQAILDFGVGAVTFRKLDNPAGIFANDDEWWGDGESLGAAEVRLKPSRNRNLIGQKIVAFARTVTGTLQDEDEPVEFPELATFDDHIYDELTAEVFIGGKTKTLVIRPEGTALPHAFGWDLGLGEAAFDDAQLVQALVGLLPPQ